MVNLEAALQERLERAFAAAAGAPADPVLRRSQHADYQADGALTLAKPLGRPPRDLARAVVERASLDDLCERVEVVGPGFINLTIADRVLSALTSEMSAGDRLGVARADDPDTVVVDYSAPNAAKEMHVGHLRSTIIGDAAVRLLEWLGHEVIRQNHIGEWGTPFGMLIEHLLDVGEAEAAHELSVGDLDGFYKAARRKFDADERFKERSRRRVVLLQGGDETTLRLWNLLVEQSKVYFLAVYERLGVRLGAGDFAGESSYNPQLASVVDELDRLGLLRVSDGAQCVFPEGFANRDGAPLPLIVRKRDGGFGYDATDLAALRHRTQDLKATRLLYVIGLPQRLHLEMIFQAGREAGWVGPGVRVEHVGHGSVLGADGRLLRSRAGASVKLIDLLDGAVRRAEPEARGRNPGLDDVEPIARAIGIGAIKFADLSADRHKDYVFDYDRMLSKKGNTALYVQYAHARTQSILNRAGAGAAEAAGAIDVAEPAERALALQLLAFEPVLRDVERSLEFHRLCGYLFDLATAFTSFFDHCPVVRAEGRVRASRLALCELTGRVLSVGLGLLGIDAPSPM